MLKRLTLASLILLLTIVPYLYLRNDVQAATFTAISDIMTRQEDTVASNHTIAFTQNGGTQFTSGETITIDFEDTFDTSSLANTDPLDYDIVINGTEETLVAIGCGATDEIEITSISGTDVITFTACGSYTAEAAGSTITIEIGTHTSAPSAGDTQIINATSSGSKIISLGGTIGDTGSIAVPILSNDQVTVSGTVDPSITSSLSDTTCTLTPNPITTAAVSVCTIANTVSTNATGGYAATIIQDGPLTSGGDTIAPVSDSNVDTAGSDEEYGIGTSDAGAADIINWDGTCDGDAGGEPSDPITATPQEYAEDAGPISAQITTVCHSIAIAGDTEAGTYTQVVTHITTGTF
ncbi:hypothetical protein IID23_04115 [Patescibacteria group bacterium]|nr:hypothetical protein [Patescibacteria group bacterium]